MKFGVVEKRIAIAVLFECGKTAKQIHSLLKPLGINERFIFRALKLYKETSDVVDRPREGRLCSVRLPNVVKAVCARVFQNPLCKPKRLAKEMNVSQRSMSRILRDDLHFGGYRHCVSHLLTPKLKEMRRDRCKNS